MSSIVIDGETFEFPRIYSIDGAMLAAHMLGRWAGDESVAPVMVRLVAESLAQWVAERESYVRHVEFGTRALLLQAAELVGATSCSPPHGSSSTVSR